MKIKISNKPHAVVFIKLPWKTKKEFLGILDRLCTDQSKVGRQLITDWINKKNNKLNKNL
jgi:hypothetical protein